MIVCLVTDRRRRPVLDHCRDAVRAGVDLVQLREPDMTGAALAALTAAMVEATHGTQTRIVVNDRLDVAIASGAHGVHLRGDSFSPAAARTVAPPGFLIGRSVRGTADAVAAGSAADYLIAGTVFPSGSKPGLGEHLGVKGLAGIAAATAVPVLAIGGITLERIEGIARAGAAGVAAIGLFDVDGARLAELVRETRYRFDSARSAS